MNKKIEKKPNLLSRQPQQVAKRLKGKPKDQIRLATLKILELAGLEAEVKVEEKDEQILIEINSNSNGLLIGKQGQNLQALERVLQVLLYSLLGKSKRISLDVAGFREKRAHVLAEVVTAAIEEVLRTHSPKTLFGLSAAERKTVHLKVSQTSNLTSESQGTGVGRVLIIKPKEYQLA